MSSLRVLLVGFLVFPSVPSYDIMFQQSKGVLVVSNEANKIEDEKLQDLFIDIRKTKNNRDKIRTLVEELVDEEVLKTCHYGEHLKTLCEAYVIKLFETYLHDTEDRQLMLAVCGLLDGYRGKTILERCRKYSTEAAEFDKRLDSNWSDPNGNIRKLEKPQDSKKMGIRDLLIKNIIQASNGNKEATNKLAKETDKELREKFPDGLPEELPLEQPLYLLTKKNVARKKDMQDTEPLVNLSNGDISANQGDSTPSGASKTNEENGITKPLSITLSGQSDEKRKTNDPDSSAHKKVSKKKNRRPKKKKIINTYIGSQKNYSNQVNINIFANKKTVFVCSVFMIASFAFFSILSATLINKQGEMLPESRRSKFSIIRSPCHLANRMR